MTVSPRTVGVVIPAYNRIDTFRRTLASLEAQTAPADLVTVVVADDGSEEDIEGLVRTWNPPFSVSYTRQVHDGFGAARARNMGASILETDVVVFLDSDGLAPPDFLKRHLEWHENAKEPTVVVGRRIHVEGAELSIDDLRRGAADLSNRPRGDDSDFRVVISRRTGGYRRTDEGYRAFVSSNVSLPLDLFTSVGGFDERFRWWGSEDSELGWRLWQTGASFVDDPENVILHQLDSDTAGGSAGRQRARELNRGLLVSLVPQRFYRKGMTDPAPEVPKVSVLVHDVPEGGPGEIWAALRVGTLTDFEVGFVAAGSDHDPFAGSAAGEPKCWFEPDIRTAIERTRGEYVVFIDGHAAPSRTMIQNIAKRLDQRPAAQVLTFGVEVPGVGTFGRMTDINRFRTDWRAELPISSAIRRRRLATELRRSEDLHSALTEFAEHPDVHTRQALVAMPSSTRRGRPEGFVYGKTPLSQVYEEARLGPSQALKVGLRVAKRRLRRPTNVEPPREPLAEGESPGVRYIGWVGKDNLGDEAMLRAAESLMPWGQISTRGEARHLLLLGGGTLINRNQYLAWLHDHDSPRLERAVLGTGVANPRYWGLTEDAEEWKQWLATCAYIGVRGPYSAETLGDWGVTENVEICGDLALALEPPSVSPVDGSILIAPASTGGELWGASDERVFECLAGAAATWIDEGRDVTLMSCHPTDDRPILIIRDLLEGRPSRYVAGYTDIEQALNRIGRSSLVVGERLHACVLAAAANRPFVGLEYRPKVSDFAASVAMEAHVARTDQLSTGFLLEQVRDLTSAPTAMSDRVREYRGRLSAASELLETSLGG